MLEAQQNQRLFCVSLKRLRPGIGGHWANKQLLMYVCCNRQNGSFPLKCQHNLQPFFFGVHRHQRRGIGGAFGTGALARPAPPAMPAGANPGMGRYLTMCCWVRWLVAPMCRRVAAAPRRPCDERTCWCEPGRLASATSSSVVPTCSISI